MAGKGQEPDIDLLGEVRPRVRSAMIGIAVLSAVLNVLLLSGSIYMLLVYDLVIPGRSEATLLGLLALVVAAYLFQGVIELVRGRVLVHLASNVDLALEGPIHRLVAEMARKAPTIDGNQPVRDLDQVRGFLSGGGPSALVDLPWALFFIAVLFLLHPYLAYTVIAGAVILVLLTLLSDRVTREYTTKLVQFASQRQSVVDVSRHHAEPLFAMGMEHRFASHWQNANRRYLGANVRLSGTAGMLAASGKTVRMLLQSLVLSVGAWLVIHGEASGGVIFASSILSSRALAPLEQVIGNWRGLVGARQSWARLKKFMARLSDDAPRQPLPVPRTALTIESLSLSPPGATMATVRDVSVLIYAGESVAVLGPSGCGKSTLIRGIAGIIDPRSGSVRLDGATLDQWPRRELGRHIGYLPQNVDLIAGTIAQNIARFDPEGAAEQVIAAAEQAGVHDMIQRLPDGYNTNVGPEGRRLSAGQRQRVALARALYGDPFLILLDEPNSNLDAEGEAALVRAIESARARRAIVITVAHRPAVLEAVDLVLLMRDGVATAYGRKERLVPHLLTHASEPPSLESGKVG